jgi:hypothetical protein
MVLHLAEELEVPLRERNGLLLAAGYAPFFPYRSLEDKEIAPVREASTTFSRPTCPPAAAVDRHWNLVG